MPDIVVTYLAPEETGEVPYAVGYDDSEQFVQFIIKGYLAPDPVTGERVVYDHGEYLVEAEGRRVFFHWGEGRIWWEEDEQPAATDKECPDCKGSGLLYIKKNPATNRPYKAWKIVDGQSCRTCGGTGRVLA